MLFRRRTLLILLTVLATFSVLAACGGDDDDSGDDDDDDSGSNGSSSRSSDEDIDIPDIKEGAFAGGKVHIEISGDKDLELDVDGNGISSNGFTLLTYGNQEAAVILGFQADTKEAPGSVSITTAEIVTGGEWGKDCSLTIEESAKELKGSFDCKDADGIAPASTKSFDVRVRGNFTATR